MIEKYLNISTVGIGEEAVTTSEEVGTKAEATHIHKCYHDEENPKACILTEVK